ncbi:hypothetical protein [Enterobacter hormaechei]|jgi:hypothetical protein|nr:hypothetical protein [Enterobacter hormaechei]WMA51871.1 hypothetical protein QPR81_17360 [Enterobacter hormaechei]
MVVFVILVIAITTLVVLERKGAIGCEIFSVALVLILSGIAGYLGVSQY